MAKTSFWHDHMELRRDGQTVGKSETFARSGEALGRTWVQTMATLNGEAVPPGEDVRRMGELTGPGRKADRVEYSLTWGEGGEEFGRLAHDKPQREYRLSVGGKILYWWWYTPWFGGARFGFDDSDQQNYVTAERYPLRTTTWQKIRVADELQEPEAIVAAQMGHTLWHTVALTSGPHGNAAFLAARL
jgi:hypothetical protein